VRVVRLRPAITAFVVAPVLVLGACGGDDGSVPAETADADADVGAALYAANCASCHGDDLRGTDRGPSHLSQVYEEGHHSDEAFRGAVEAGSVAHHWNFGDMAPVRGLTEAEVAAIIAFIRSVQEAEGFEPYPPD